MADERRGASFDASRKRFSITHVNLIYCIFSRKHIHHRKVGMPERGELRQKVERTLEAVGFGITQLLESLREDSTDAGGAAGSGRETEALKAEASVFAFFQMVLEQSYGRGVSTEHRAPLVP